MFFVFKALFVLALTLALDYVNSTPIFLSRCLFKRNSVLPTILKYVSWKDLKNILLESMFWLIVLLQYLGSGTQVIKTGTKSVLLFNGLFDIE